MVSDSINASPKSAPLRTGICWACAGNSQYSRTDLTLLKPDYLLHSAKIIDNDLRTPYSSCVRDDRTTSTNLSGPANLESHSMSQKSETVKNAAPVAMPASFCEGQSRVLLVEDDRAVRRYLQVILQRAGYRVICAADGLEAMKLALSQSLDAVVTDAIMPHFSGQEFCRFLRSYPTLSNLPVILLSAFDKKSSEAEGEGHADVCLTKPVKPEELTSHLARLIQEKHVA